MATFIDNSAEVLAQLAKNKLVALNAMGMKGKELTLDNMQGGYAKPIWKTGALQRDVDYQVEYAGPDTVTIGNGLEYAPYVHDGTYKMAGRPYLRDALMNGKDDLQAVAEKYLKQGF